MSGIIAGEGQSRHFPENERDESGIAVKVKACSSRRQYNMSNSLAINDLSLLPQRACISASAATYVEVDRQHAETLMAINQVYVCLPTCVYRCLS